MASQAEPQNALDPRERPPESILAFYKQYRKLNLAAIDLDPNIIDLSRNTQQSSKLIIVRYVNGDTLKESCTVFDGYNADSVNVPCADLPIYECKCIPGLLLIPSLLPQQTQWTLLSRLLHDALADPRHKTNVNAHYDVPYVLLEQGKDTKAISGGVLTQLHTARSSFFSISPKSKDSFQPLNPTIHKPYNISQFLRKKLRWIDLGGQYDWTDKIYHTENAPPFPSDIANLMRSIFPDTNSEVAIVNIYSPGDTLSIHRDVSETSTNGLISVSLGCDSIFIVGLRGEDEQMNNVAIRLRSGDAIYMSRSARYAWHGVSQIIPGTCPAYLSDWPAKSPSKMAPVEVKESNYEAWRGWMFTKRINLNIRQLNP